jgi:succinoglycan biosynthesis transport protein ExoP
MKPDTPDTLDLYEYLMPIRRYAPLIATFCIAATLSSLAFTYAVSERYKARTTLLYQPREDVSFRPKSRDALGFPPPLVPLESIGNTLEEVLKSDAIVSQTVKLLNLHVKETPAQTSLIGTVIRETKDTIKEWRQNAMEILKHGRILPKDPFTQAMLTLKSNVSIKRTAKAYTFELEVVNENARRAALIADTMGPLLSRFLAAEHARAARESRQKIEPRLKDAFAEISALRDELDAAKSSIGVTSLAEQMSLKLEAIDELESQLTSVTNDLQSNERRSAALGAQLETEAPDIKYESTVAQNPIVDDMKLAIARLEVERSGLLEQFTPEHHQVKVLDARIEQAQQTLRQEVARTVRSESTRVNDLHRKLLADKLVADADIQSLRARERGLRSALTRGQEAARTLTENEPRIAELTLRLRAGEQSYELIHESYEEARLAEARETSEVSVLHAALIPPAPARPIKIVHVGSSLLLSLCLGIAFALFTNLFDETVRTIRHTERVMEVPVLATVPAMDPEHAGLLMPHGYSNS